MLPTFSDSERKTLVKSSSSNQYIRVPISIGQTTSETALHIYDVIQCSFCIFIVAVSVFFRDCAAFRIECPRFLVAGYKICKRHCRHSADCRNPSPNYEWQTCHAVTYVPFWFEQVKEVSTEFVLRRATERPDFTDKD